MQRKTGVIKFFNRAKGFGFIIPDDDQLQDVFVHYSDIDGEGYRNLYEGDQVSFEPVPNGEKGTKAADVRIRA